MESPAGKIHEALVLAYWLCLVLRTGCAQGFGKRQWISEVLVGKDHQSCAGETFLIGPGPRGTTLLYKKPFVISVRPDEIQSQFSSRKTKKINILGKEPILILRRLCFSNWDLETTFLQVDLFLERVSGDLLRHNSQIANQRRAIATGALRFCGPCKLWQYIERSSNNNSLREKVYSRS